MQALKKIYKFLSYEIEAPKMFGLFHSISVSITAFLTTILCIKCKYTSEKTERRIAFWVWIVLFALETYKQFVYFFSLEDDVLSLSYSWHGFPFQLCSAPLYVLPLIAFLPSGKLREAFTSFYGTFVLLGGIAVCIYPGNVLVPTLGINIHTMVWHGSQVFLGIYFNLRRFSGKNPPKLNQYFLRALPIFLTFVAIALSLNVGFYHMLEARGMDDTFNMFFISPYFECIFPILDIIQAHTPYPVFLLSYILLLSIFSYALILVEWAAIKKLDAKKVKKEAQISNIAIDTKELDDNESLDNVKPL